MQETQVTEDPIVAVGAMHASPVGWVMAKVQFRVVARRTCPRGVDEVL